MPHCLHTHGIVETLLRGVTSSDVVIPQLERTGWEGVLVGQANHVLRQGH